MHHHGILRSGLLFRKVGVLQALLFHLAIAIMLDFQAHHTNLYSITLLVIIGGKELLDRIHRLRGGEN